MQGVNVNLAEAQSRRLATSMDDISGDIIGDL